MKYLKLFESNENMIDNILDVFQSIQDFELELSCEKMYEFSVKLDDMFYHSTSKQGNNIFNGYFLEGRSDALDWLDDEGNDYRDYYGKDFLTRSLIKYNFRNIDKKDSFYRIEITGKYGYITDNFSEISSEIRNGVLRLKSMYGLRSHNNKSIFYRNGLLASQGSANQEFFPINWESNSIKGYDINVPRNRFCYLSICLK